MNFYFNSTRLQDFFFLRHKLCTLFLPHTFSSFVTNLRFQNLVSMVYHLACVAGSIVSTRFKFLRRSRDPKKGVGTRLTPLVAAPPPNLTRLIHSTSTQYRHSASYAGYGSIILVPRARRFLVTWS